MFVARIEAVVAVVGFGGSRRPIGAAKPRIGLDDDFAGLLHQPAREQGYHRRLGPGIGLGVPRTGKTRHVTGMLQHRVLETGAGAEVGQPRFPGIPDGHERAGLASVGTVGNDPDPRGAAEGIGDAGVERLGADPVPGHRDAERHRGEGERVGNRAMRRNPGIAIADQRDVDRRHAVPSLSGRSLPARMPRGQTSRRGRPGSPQASPSSRAKSVTGSR